MTVPTTRYNDDRCGNVVHQPYTAYLQGGEAFEMGLLRGKNPYEAATQEHVWWNSGWDDALEVLKLV